MPSRTTSVLGDQLSRVHAYTNGAQAALSLARKVGEGATMPRFAMMDAGSLADSASYVLSGITRGREGLPTGTGLTYRVRNFRALHDAVGEASLFAKNVDQLRWAQPTGKVEVFGSGGQRSRILGFEEARDAAIAQSISLGDQITALPGFDRFVMKGQSAFVKPGELISARRELATISGVVHSETMPELATAYRAIFGA